MGCQRQGKYEGNPSTLLSPLGITEEEGCGHQRAREREGERVCDGPMSEQRATGYVQRPPKEIDVWQRRASRGDETDPLCGHSL